MAERPIERQAFNTLTSFYKNKGFKPNKSIKICVSKLIILWYVWNEGWQQIFGIFMMENRNKTIIDQKGK